MNKTYICAEGHAFTLDFSLCPVLKCGAKLARIVYGKERQAPSAAPAFISNDPFRKAWLSSEMESNLQKQGRGLMEDSPRDNFEAREMGRRLGRQYIGNDLSGLNPKARRAIERSNGKNV